MISKGSVNSVEVSSNKTTKKPKVPTKRKMTTINNCH